MYIYMYIYIIIIHIYDNHTYMYNYICLCICICIYIHITILLSILIQFLSKCLMFSGKRLGQKQVPVRRRTAWTDYKLGSKEAETANQTLSRQSTADTDFGPSDWLWWLRNVAHFQDLLDTKLLVFRLDTCASPNLIKFEGHKDIYITIRFHITDSRPSGPIGLAVQISGDLYWGGSPSRPKIKMSPSTRNLLVTLEAQKCIGCCIQRTKVLEDALTYCRIPGWQKMGRTWLKSMVFGIGFV